MESQKKKPGRKARPKELKKKAHQVYATDAEWGEIEKLAEAAKQDVSPYIIQRILAK